MKSVQKIQNVNKLNLLSQKLIDLKIEENTAYNLEEIKKICRDVIKYSVKTSHGRFHNQLFGQMDPYGLAGSWITEALNTSS